MALRLVGLKTEGSTWPVPHSESVKVLGPKWRNMAMWPSCHWSWGAEGRGSIGRGGGFLSNEDEQEVEESESERRSKRWSLGMELGIGVWVFFLFFMIMMWVRLRDSNRDKWSCRGCVASLDLGRLTPNSEAK